MRWPGCADSQHTGSSTGRACPCRRHAARTARSRFKLPESQHVAYLQRNDCTCVFQPQKAAGDKQSDQHGEDSAETASSTAVGGEREDKKQDSEPAPFTTKWLLWSSPFCSDTHFSPTTAPKNTHTIERGPGGLHVTCSHAIAGHSACRVEPSLLNGPVTLRTVSTAVSHQRTNRWRDTQTTAPNGSAAADDACHVFGLTTPKPTAARGLSRVYDRCLKQPDGHCGPRRPAHGLQ